jgi:predicted DNA-binding transcriptional regulator AlpA
MHETPASAGVSAFCAEVLPSGDLPRGHTVVTACATTPVSPRTAFSNAPGVGVRGQGMTNDDEGPGCHAAPVQLLTAEEVRGLFRVSTTWLYIAAKKGRIPCLRIGGPKGPVRFSRSELEAYISERHVGPRPRGTSGEEVA